MPHFHWQNNTLILHCHIQPNASKDEVVGLHDNALKIRLQAPPLDGKANKHLIDFLSGQFSVPKSQVQLLRGRSNRRKSLSIVAPKTLPSACLITPVLSE